MKNIVKTAILALALLAVSNTRAIDKFEVLIDADREITISLTKTNVGERLVIKNFAGSAIYNKQLSQMAIYEEQFSMRSLKNGVYFVEVEDATEVRITPVLKNDKEIKLIPIAGKTITKPQFVENTDGVTFSWDNESGKEVSWTVYNELGQVLTSEEGVNDLLVVRSFDASHLARGVYTIAVAKEKRTFTKTIHVN